MAIDKVRKRVQESIEKAHQDYKKKLFGDRLVYCRNGAIAFNKKNFKQSAEEFETYIRIVEEWKGLPEGGVNPACFSQKKEMGELLLVSAVIWELVKLYDHSPAKEAQFVKYLEKYIAFARAMPFQGLCAESVRKYLANGRAVHKEQMRNAYRMLGGQRCYVATALMDVTGEDTLDQLRDFRDEYLKERKWGRSLVALYYLKSRKLVPITDALPNWVREILGIGLDALAHMTDWLI